MGTVSSRPSNFLILIFSCFRFHFPLRLSSAKGCVSIFPCQWLSHLRVLPLGHRCPKISALRGKPCVTSIGRLVSVASLNIGLGVPYSLNWYDELGSHEEPIHSADLLHLQTSNPASTPAQVQGSVRFHTTLGQDDRMLFLRFGHG
ncbi:hypothetical protein BDW62DRAFT_53337 [Aspergillus aurantiobrunneus]